jgi:hypothetical protein
MTGRLPGDERTPGEKGRLAGCRFFKRVRERRHRGLDVMERRLSVFDPFQGVRDGGQDAAQAGIGGERSKHRACLNEPFRGRRDLIQR